MEPESKETNNANTFSQASKQSQCSHIIIYKFHHIVVKVKGLVARPVPMRVTNEDVPSIRDVDPIGEVGDALTPDNAQVERLPIEP